MLGKIRKDEGNRIKSSEPVQGEGILTKNNYSKLSFFPGEHYLQSKSILEIRQFSGKAGTQVACNGSKVPKHSTLVLVELDQWCQQEPDKRDEKLFQEKHYHSRFQGIRVLKSTS